MNLYELIRHVLTQGHVGNTKTWNADIHSGNILQIIPSLHGRKKALILQQHKLVLSEVKKYIDTHLNPKTNNLYSPTENFYQPDKPINAILQELQISEDQFYKA